MVAQVGRTKEIRDRFRAERSTEGDRETSKTRREAHGEIFQFEQISSIGWKFWNRTRIVKSYGKRMNNLNQLLCASARHSF
eukprot:768504-Hanusia_phi.AAC.3